jgi:7tm Chemosensory receptor
MIRKSELLVVIAPCLGIFEFLGFGDFRKVFSWSFAKYLAMNVIVTAILVDFVWNGAHSELGDSSALISFINFILIIVGGLLCINSTFLYSSTSRRFFDRIAEVDELLINALSLSIDYDDLRWTLLIKTGLSLTFYFGLSFITLFSVWFATPQLMKFSVYFYIQLLIVQVYSQRFVFMVQLLTFYLEMTAGVLEKSISNQPLLVRSDERRSWLWNMRSNHRRIQVLRQTYRRLWEASCLINDWSGVGIAYVFLVQTVFIIYQGYRICVRFASGVSSVRNLMSISQTITSIFVAHYYCQQCLDAVSRSNGMKFYLPRSLLHFTDKEDKVLRSSAQQWSLLVSISSFD